MDITRDTRLADLLKEYPWLKDEAIKFNEKAKMIDSPIGRILIKKATVADLCKKADLDESETIARLKDLIEARS